MMEYSKYSKLKNEYCPGVKTMVVSTYTKSLKYNDGTKRFNTNRTKITLEFDPNGVLRSMNETFYSNRHKLKGINSTYTYSVFNNPIVVLKHNTSNNRFIKEYYFSYYKNEKIKTEKEFYYSEGAAKLVKMSETQHAYFEYIHLINNIQLINYRPKEEKINILHDSNDRMIEYKSTSNNNKVHNWYKYKYNTDGYIILKEDVKSNSSTLFFYKAGKLIKKETYDLSSGNQYKGNLIYNDRGHWIKEVTLRNNELYEVKVRDIVYYE